MKYALLVYGDQAEWETLSEDERASRRAESMPGWVSLFGALQAADPGVSGHELEEARAAKVVRVRDGERIVTDGPFAETKEVFGGYYVIEAPDLDAAIASAARIPGAQHGSIEIRPLVDWSQVPGGEAVATSAG